MDGDKIIVENKDFNTKNKILLLFRQYQNFCKQFREKNMDTLQNVYNKYIVNQKMKHGILKRQKRYLIEIDENILVLDSMLNLVNKVLETLHRLYQYLKEKRRILQILQQK